MRYKYLIFSPLASISNFISFIHIIITISFLSRVSSFGGNFQSQGFAHTAQAFFSNPLRLARVFNFKPQTDKKSINPNPFSFIGFTNPSYLKPWSDQSFMPHIFLASSTSFYIYIEFQFFSKQGSFNKMSLQSRII